MWWGSLPHRPGKVQPRGGFLPIEMSVFCTFLDVFMSRIKLHLGSSVLVCVVTQVFLETWHWVSPRLREALVLPTPSLGLWTCPPEMSLFPTVGDNL